MIIQVKVKILGGNSKHYQHTAPPMNQKQAENRHDHNDDHISFVLIQK